MCPRKKFYDLHRVEVLGKQRIKRKKEKERIQRALEELERLAKINQQTLDRLAFESQEVKRIVKKQIKEDAEEENLEGAKIW